MGRQKPVGEEENTFGRLGETVIKNKEYESSSINKLIDHK